MPANIEKHRADLASLAALGEEMLIDRSLRDGAGAAALPGLPERVRGGFE